MSELADYQAYENFKRAGMGDEEAYIAALIGAVDDAVISLLGPGSTMEIRTKLSEAQKMVAARAIEKRYRLNEESAQGGGPAGAGEPENPQGREVPPPPPVPIPLRRGK